MIRIEDDDFPSLLEIWGESDQVLIVLTADHRYVRVSARRNIRSGAAPSYFAYCEERQRIGDPDRGPEVWVDVHYPWQDGATAEACLQGALRWVDSEKPERL